MQVQLASIHNKQIRLHDEGLRVISSFPQNIVILSIVGASRCGKSTLCNLILKLLGIPVTITNMFSVGSGSSAITSGIWIWGQPLPIPGKPDMHLLLMDTEGLDKGDDHELRLITSIACLLSSSLIFNMRGEPSNTDLRHAAVMGEVVRLTRGGCVSDFPLLLLLSRDVTHEWMQETMKQGINLEHLVDKWLQSADGSAESQLHSQTVRTCFPRVRMVTVPPPDRSDSKALPNLIAGSEFSEKMTHVIKEQILAKLEVKSVGGARASGALIANEYLPKVVNVLNATDPVSIPTLIETYNSSLCQKLVAEAVHHYHQNWMNFTASSMDQLQPKHSAALQVGLNVLNPQLQKWFASGSPMIKKAQDDLNTACQPEFERQKNEVAQRLREQAEQLRRQQEEQARLAAIERQRAEEESRRRAAELAQAQEHNRRMQGLHLVGEWQGTGMGVFRYTVTSVNGELQGKVIGGHPRHPYLRMIGPPCSFTARMTSPTQGTAQAGPQARMPATVAVSSDNLFTLTMHTHRGPLARTFTRV